MSLWALRTELNSSSKVMMYSGFFVANTYKFGLVVYVEFAFISLNLSFYYSVLLYDCSPMLGTHTNR